MNLDRGLSKLRQRGPSSDASWHFRDAAWANLVFGDAFQGESGWAAVHMGTAKGPPGYAGKPVA